MESRNDLSENERILGVIKIVAFPGLLAVVVYFLVKLDKKIENINDTMIEIKINQRVLQHDVNDLINDTSILRVDVEELKKNLIET